MPDDATHTIYVWIEALINYLTVAGFPWSSSPNALWPPDTMVIGKDIIR